MRHTHTNAHTHTRTYTYAAAAVLLLSNTFNYIISEPDLPEASGGGGGAAGVAQEPEEPAERLPAGADAPGDRPLQAQGAAPATGHHLHQTHQPV